MKERTLTSLRQGQTAASRKNAGKIIELKHLVKVYDGKTVVDDISLSIVKGEFVTLLGPSGCGKTTTLRMIAGFEMPTSGQVFLEGQDVTALPPHKRNVNTVFQKYALFPHLNVFNNVAFGLKLKRIPAMKDGKEVKTKISKQVICEKVNAALKLVNLEEYGHRDVDSLSGGQQQRVAIARALVNEPKVLLLDEPLGALDLKMRKEMQIELMRMHRELGITFIYVTHDQEEALTMSDTIVVMNDGVIQQVGSPKKIYDEPENSFVADFIGESNIMSGVMLDDFKVKFLGRIFVCEDKGFDKNEVVDVVIRPEDIYVYGADNQKGMLKGEVLSAVFKGTYYEMNIKSGDYEFTVQDTTERRPGDQVSLTIKPDAIHIMEQQSVINEIKTEFYGGGVEIGGEKFVVSDLFIDQFSDGDLVTAKVAFDKVELTDDENDGVVGANVADIIYKGSYYQVKVWTDNDTDFVVNTPYEWDANDRVGIKINPADITLEMRTEVTAEKEEEEND